MSRAMRVIFTNWKGGVGKSTLCRELSCYASKQGFKVLLIDADPQGNLSKGLSKKEDPSSGGLYEALNGQGIEFKFIDPNLRLLSGDIRLSALERSLIGEIDAFERFKYLLTDPLFDEFDFIFTDTPPSLGTLTINALAASERLVIPMNPSQYTMQGTRDLLDTFGKVRSSLNPGITVAGVILNQYDGHPVINREIRQQIEEAFQDHLFRSSLSRSIRLEEAVALREGVVNIPLMEGTKTCREIGALGKELLARLGYGNEETQPS